MLGLFTCSDINNKYVKYIDYKELKLVANSSKTLHNIFYRWWILNKNLNNFYKNYVENKFNNIVTNKLKILFSDVKNELKYYKTDENMSLHMYKSDSLYELNKSDYIFGKHKSNRIYLCIRKEITKNKYSYLLFDNIHYNNYTTSYSNPDILNIINAKNHTFKCGCGNIFTCTKSNLLNTQKLINHKVI